MGLEALKKGESRDVLIKTKDMWRSLNLQDNLKFNIFQSSWYLVWVDNAAPRIHGLLNEIFGARHGILPYEVLVRKAPEAPKTTQAIVTALGWLP